MLNKAEMKVENILCVYRLFPIQVGTSSLYV